MLHLYDSEILACNSSIVHLLRPVQLRRNRSVQCWRSAIDGSRSADLIPASDVPNFDSDCNQVASR